ncbi:F-box/WD repeat-containing protein 9 isoform X2 [Cephus cinctus]|uniref:F-box/WD repeat-containing protein 9 isoform X2 n=1 Tax=Cephus cinctus TaxID=211228 RepID=A0AAJ7RB97_CEPCN|nr:F-box/WD repeat-containing protein 9 isoform X2 [Cephus cinctus]
MDKEKSSSPTQHDDNQNDSTSHISLLDLPIEILLHICSFLDASTLVHGLGLVCKHFHQILLDDSLWKVRISQIWPNTGFPVLPPASCICLPAEDDELFWKLSCVAIERQTLLWRNSVERDSMENVFLDNVHYGTIDGVLLMRDGTVCISGARDRSLVYWTLPTEENKFVKSMAVELAHEGWIWDLTAIDNTVYSCSWDRTVKAWELTNTGLTHLTTYEMIVSGALLCVTSCSDLPIFATGSFSKTVLVFDPRKGYSPIARYQPHNRAVIRLSMNSDYILSASEDKSVSIWDQRAGRIMKTVMISKESFPMSVSMNKGIVYVGDSGAKLHVLNPKKDFELKKCYTTKHEKAITGLHVAPGCLITGSLDKTVIIWSPTDPPQHVETLTSPYGEVPSIDYMNEVLAVSGTDGIKIWRPRTDTYAL